jgi:hypothetical protein
MVWSGDWSASNPYVSGNTVGYNGSSYICISAHTNQVPPNLTYWNVVAQSGAAGATGQTGPTGATGPQGIASRLYIPLNGAGTSVAWTNMASAAQLLFAASAGIIRVDLTNYVSGRLLVNKLATAGATNSRIFLRYWTGYTQTAATYIDIGLTGAISVAVNNTNTFTTTAWQALTGGAKADVFVTIIGTGGDGTLDPAFGAIGAEFV